MSFCTIVILYNVVLYYVIPYQCHFVIDSWHPMLLPVSSVVLWELLSWGHSTLGSSSWWCSPCSSGPPTWGSRTPTLPWNDVVNCTEPSPSVSIPWTKYLAICFDMKYTILYNLCKNFDRSMVETNALAYYLACSRSNSIRRRCYKAFFVVTHTQGACSRNPLTGVIVVLA